MKNIFIVFIGTGIGGALRYGASILIKWNGSSFPWATWMVNILGCFIMGLVIAIANKNSVFAENYKLVLTSGLCGGFTTFSAFSSESLQLIKQGNLMLAFCYITASILIGLAACASGFLFAK